MFLGLRIVPIVAWAVVTLGLLRCGDPTAAAAPASEILLPQTTALWVSVPDFSVMDAQWQGTEIGKLINDPIMKPFRADLRRQLEERRADRKSGLDISWEDIKSIAGGEASISLIPSPGKPARTVIVDTTGRTKQIEALRARLHADLVKQGANHIEKTVTVAGAAEGTAVTVALYMQDGKVRTASFLADNVYCASESALEVYYIAARFRGWSLAEQEAPLSAATSFQQVTARLKADQPAKMADKLEPHVRWFLRPFAYAEARRAANPKKAGGDDVDMLEALKKSGFTSFAGIGGFARFSDTEYDTLHRMAIYAPTPWNLSMNMVALANGDGLTIKKGDGNDWIPPSIASHTTGYVELVKAFDNFGPLFNQVLADGRDGVWTRTLRGFKTDPLGPRVDFRKEIVENLVESRDGRLLARCTTITDNREPVEPGSGRQLTAVKIRRGAENVVYEAFRRYYESEGETVILRKDVVPGIHVWELLSEDEEAEAALREIPDLRIRLEPGAGANVRVVAAPKAAKLESRALCITGGHLFYATKMSLMLKVLQHISTAGKPLADDADYVKVMGRIDTELDQRGWKSAAVRRFLRGDERFHVTYELARMGRLDETDAWTRNLAKMIDPASTKPLDLKKLPAFDPVRPFLRPGGSLIHDETAGQPAAGPNGWNGWFIVNFSLKR